MPNPPEFPFDERSNREAADLCDALQKYHLAEVHTRPTEILLSGPNLQQVQNVRRRFTGPLHEVEGKIPVADLLADVEDFGVLAAYAQLGDRKMVVVRQPNTGIVVPVLPEVGLLEQYQRSGWPSVPPTQSWFDRKFFEASLDKKTLDQVPVKEAEHGFFSGLKSFLAARIGGMRSRRSGGIGGSSGGGRSGGGGGGGGSSTGGGAAQLWKVHTNGSGFSLAYHGTHAARVPTALPGGVTTPVDVYLPTGTLYLGANAGARGTFIFDYGVVLNVPSAHARPIHSTQAF